MCFGLVLWLGFNSRPKDNAGLGLWFQIGSKQVKCCSWLSENVPRLLS